MKITIPICMSLLVLLTACPSKDKTIVQPTNAELVADSAYLYTKEVYLWNTIPGIGTYESFNPRQYVNADLVKTGDNVVKAIRALQSADHFSFATSVAESNQISTGQGEDWGLFVKSGLVAEQRIPANVRWFVTYVYSASDAAAKGVKRGWIVNKLNGVEMRGDDASVTKLNDWLFGTVKTATIEFVKPDATTQTLVLSKTLFTANAVLYSTTYNDVPGKKIGYMVFNAFLGSQAAYSEVSAVFDSFIGQGINELIVDLRNNLGGITAMQDYLANILVPASKNGTTMYRYEFNQQLQQDNFPLLKKKFGWSNGMFTAANNTETFVKNKTLALNRLFFIVTDNTASSSELLINNLKPMMNVQLIGDTTYGKPVGFFPITLFDQVALYPISFRTINSQNTEVPYLGFAPDKSAIDGINKDWGDIADPCLANARAYISNGSYLAAAPASPLQTMPRSVFSSKLKQLDEKRMKNVGIYFDVNKIK